VRSAGSEFQIVGAGRQNARLPNTVLAQALEAENGRLSGDDVMTSEIEVRRIGMRVDV